jgi:hypothetical protein
MKDARKILEDFVEAGRGNLFRILNGNSKQTDNQTETHVADEEESDQSPPSIGSRKQREFEIYEPGVKKKERTLNIAAIALEVLESETEEQVDAVAVKYKLDRNYMFVDIRMFLKALAIRQGSVRPIPDVLLNFRAHKAYWLPPVKARVWLDNFSQPGTTHHFMKTMFQSMRPGERHEVLMMLKTMVTDNS